jgi:hypothetical protein
MAKSDASRTAGFAQRLVDVELALEDFDVEALDLLRAVSRRR